MILIVILSVDVNKCNIQRKREVGDTDCGFRLLDVSCYCGFLVCEGNKEEDMWVVNGSCKNSMLKIYLVMLI